MAKVFTYTKFPVSVDRLTVEVQTSAITVALDHINLFGDNLDIFFKADLPAEDVTILDAIVADHTGEPTEAEQASAIAIAEQSSYYSPSPASYKVGKAPILVDADQKQVTRGQVLTDEGSFRDDFSGTSLSRSLSGTFDFSNTSDQIVYSSEDVFDNVLYPYFKLDGDDDSAFTQGEITSLKSISLFESYKGSSGSGTAILSNWIPTVTGNGNISVANSWITLSANGAESSASIYKAIDYLPIKASFKVKISSRVSGQEIKCGLTDAAGVIKCVVHFTGTDPTKLTFISTSENTEHDRQQTIVSLPLNKVTSDEHIYTIEVVNGHCSLLVDDLSVAIHRDHVPDAYDSLGIVASIANSSTATMAIDWTSFQSIDQLDVTNTFSNSPTHVDLVSPKSLDGKPVITSSPRPIGTYSVFTSIGDNQDTPSEIAHGTLLKNAHKQNDPMTQSIYLDVNSIVNETHIYKASIQWRNAEFDEVECEIVTKSSTFETGENTNYAVVNHVLIQVPGIGNKIVDFATVNPVQMVANEYGIIPPGYWDCTYNSTTKAFENFVFNPYGKGAFNIFDAEVEVNCFVPTFVMLGDGLFTFESDDVTRLGHNFIMKVILITNGADHDWDFCGNVFLYRKKTC